MSAIQSEANAPASWAQATAESSPEILDERLKVLALQFVQFDVDVFLESRVFEVFVGDPLFCPVKAGNSFLDALVLLGGLCVRIERGQGCLESCRSLLNE